MMSSSSSEESLLKSYSRSSSTALVRALPEIRDFRGFVSSWMPACALVDLMSKMSGDDKMTRRTWLVSATELATLPKPEDPPSRSPLVLQGVPQIWLSTPPL